MEGTTAGQQQGGERTAQRVNAVSLLPLFPAKAVPSSSMKAAALPQRKNMIPVPVARSVLMSASEILLALAPEAVWSSLVAIDATRTKYLGLLRGVGMISGSQVRLPKMAWQGAVGEIVGAIDGCRGVGDCVGASSGTSQYTPDHSKPGACVVRKKRVLQNAECSRVSSRLVAPSVLRQHERLA